MTQADKIIHYMYNNGSITAMEALNYCGCFRLASRIHDIRKLGYNIKVESVKVKNRDGSTSTVAKYSIIDEEKG